MIAGGLSSAGRFALILFAAGLTQVTRPAPLLARPSTLMPIPIGTPPPCLPILAASTGRSWPAPLDRLVTIEAGRVSLRDGLDRIAAAAGFRLSYSGDDLPVDREVCLTVRAVPAGQALEAILSGTGVEPLVVSSRQVVLPPPTRDSEAAPTQDQAMQLETIVVTGTSAGGARRPLAMALDVIPGSDLRLFGGGLAATLNGAVPGLWLWPQAPTSVLANYGSIRGTSSFGLSYPKVFIDGIELANPLLLTGLAPEAVDRIEIIRGPQGATLYGAEAISGVMNIVTRQEGADPGAARIRVASEAEFAATDYASSPAVGQRHALTARFGSNLMSGALHLAGAIDGPSIPGASHQEFSGHGTFRRVAEGSILTGLARLAYEAADAAPSPLLPDSIVLPRRRTGASGTQSVLGYTVGANLKFPRERWTHTLTGGLDGYRLDGVSDDRSAIPSAIDSALLAAAGGAVRGTLRAGTVRQIGLGKIDWSTITVTAEHSILHHWSAVNSGPGSTSDIAGTRHNSSGSMIGALGVRERYFLSGGVRVETTTGNDPTLIPTVGAAVLLGGGDATIKFRGAYGKGVRWSDGAPRTSLLQVDRRPLSTAGLDPEEQSGLEGGIDLLLAGGAITLAATRFDQVASGLIQRVASLDTAGPGLPSVVYSLENIGEITNRGWEISLVASQGPFSLSAAWSQVDSRVRRLAPRYGGDLQPGDRMLEVPRNTMSLTARYRAGPWSGAVSVARAEDWINYDRLGIATDFAAGGPRRDFVGQRLRAYWKQYDGVTRLRLTLMRELGNHLTLSATGENLLDEQRGEPDNITVVPGRSVRVGLSGAW